MSRLKILQSKDADTQRLYGTLDDAISYLQEMKAKLPADASLEEHWTGYEDMELRFVWYREETDVEYLDRMSAEEERRREEIRKKEEDRQKAERRKAWEELNREFGRKGY